MVVTMEGKYTYRNGEPARILCIDRAFSGKWVVLSMRHNGAIVQSTIEGKSECYENELDLIEIWEPKHKEPVWAWDNDWKCRSLEFWDDNQKKLYNTRYKYHNIAKVEHIEQWMLDIQKELED